MKVLLLRALAAAVVSALAATSACAERAHAASAPSDGTHAAPDADAVVRALQDDDALLERVANALANDPELGNVEITVYVGEGHVALQGETQTAGQAVRAVAVTRRAAGSGVDVRSELRSDDPHDAAGA